MKNENTAEKNEYGNLRIVSLDGSQIYRRADGRCDLAPYSTINDGKLNPDAFGGILDESLDTDKLCEVYEKHKAELPFAYTDNGNYTRALVSVSFDYAVKEFEPHRQRYVRYGFSVSDEDMTDHICVRTVGGAPVLIAVEIWEESSSDYAPVEKPVGADILGKYFVYDADKRAYRRTKRDIPSVVKKAEIREKLYSDGFDIDRIHYVRYKRSAGSSRDGRCLFIAEPLYQDMMDWSSCGLSADSVSDQASWQAYIALTLSSIEATVKLPKKAILIIRDRESVFTDTVVCVREDAKEGLSAKEETAEIRNVIWDGEALLDVSVFEENGYSDKAMMLLRNRFFKTCAFNTNLQKWFKDKGITQICQLGGYTTARKVEDIKLVITESSVKYLKFMPKDMNLGEAFRTWLDAVYEGKNTSPFGVVKTDELPTLMLGNMAYTNYQLLNTVNINRRYMRYFLDASFDYLGKIQADPMYLRYFAKTATFEPDGEYKPITVETYRSQVIVDMMARSDEFAYTDVYKSYRNEACRSFKEKLKRGRVLVEGNYQTIFGNPYEFLCATIDKSYEATEPLLFDGDEVYTKRFDDEDGGYVLCTRSPHITMGNLYLARNTAYGEIDKYFNLTYNIICVNAIGNNIQQRLNGCDYDSDTMLVTINQHLLSAVKSEYASFKVPVCAVAPCGKSEYENTPKGLARLDGVIAENKIGDIVNLSQFLNSLLWHRISEGESLAEMLPLYYDICKLAVLSGMEIDKAKRMYSVKTDKVLRLLKKPRDAYKKAHGGKLPEFFRFMTADDTTPATDESAKLMTPMSFVYDHVEQYRSQVRKTKNVPLSSLFELDASDVGANDTHKKQQILKAVEEAQKEISSQLMRARHAKSADKLIYREKAQKAYENCLSAVSKLIQNEHILCMLLKELDKGKDSKYGVTKYRHLLFASMLYEKEKRMLKKVKGMYERTYPELLFLDASPEAAYGYVTENLYGFPHVIMDMQMQKPTEK